MSEIILSYAEEGCYVNFRPNSIAENIAQGVMKAPSTQESRAQKKHHVHGKRSKKKRSNDSTPYCAGIVSIETHKMAADPHDA